MNTIELVAESWSRGEMGLRIVLGATAIWLAAAVAAAVLRRSSSALRHRIWGLASLAVLALPPVLPWIPCYPLGWLDISRSAALVENGPRDQPTESPIAVESDNAAPRASDSYRNRDRNGLAVVSARSAPEARSVPDPTRAREESFGQPRNSSSPDRAAALGLILWALAAAGFATSTFGSLLAARGLVRRAAPIHDPRCRERLDRLAARCMPKAQIDLRESAAAHSPLCVGLVRPCIILPIDWRGWPVEQLDGILAHEMAHAIRRDVLWQLAACLASALYWFHPLAWLAAARMRTEREAACDNWALSAGTSPAQYARALFEIASRFQRAHSAPPAAAVAMGPVRSFEQRVRAILARDRDRSTVGTGVGRLVSAGTLAVFSFAVLLNPLASGGGDKNVRKSAARPLAGKSGEGKKPQAGVSETATADSGVESMVRFAGRVVDESKRPVEGAVVEVLAHRARPSVRSAADGSFAITAPKWGVLVPVIRATVDDGARQAIFQVDAAELLPASIDLVLRPVREVPVTVVDGKDRPVAGALVAAMCYWYESMDEGQSDANGKIVLRVPADCSLQYVFAVKDGAGLDYYVYRRKGAPAQNGFALPPDSRKPVTLVLNGSQEVTVRIIDNRGAPVAQSPVYAWYFEKPKKGEILNVGGFHAFNSKTDDEGRALFRNIPVDNVGEITFQLYHDDYFAPDRAIYKPCAESNELDMTVLPRMTVRGRVTFADGRPAARVEVLAAGDGYTLDVFRGSARTRNDGRFEMRVDPNQYYLFCASLGRLVSPAVARVIRPGEPVEEIRLALENGTRVYGRLTEGKDQQPMAGEYVHLYQRPAVDHAHLPADEQLPNPRSDRKWVSPALGRSVRTDAEGKFEFFTSAGRHYMLAPQGTKPPQFVVGSEEEIEFELHSEEPRRVELTARVVLASDRTKPVGDARVFGIGLALVGFLDAATDADGKFSAARPPAEMVLIARTEDGKLAGLVRIQPGDRTCEIPVAPTRSVRGRLVDSTGQIMAHRQLDYCARIDPNGMTKGARFGGSVTTDADGEFVITGLAPNWPYDLQVPVEPDGTARPSGWMPAGSVEPKSDEVEDLGDVRVNSGDF